MLVIRALFLLVVITHTFLVAVTFVEDSSLQSHILKYVGNQTVPSSRRSIVIYRVGEVLRDGSYDVYENNIKFFSAAIVAHAASAKHQAIYVFRVVGGKRNKLVRYLPQNLPHVILSKCHSHTAKDMASHIHTIHILGDQVLSKFYSVMLLSHEARGPFEGHKDGSWWDRIINTFNTKPKVAIVGPLISCEVAPHVQSHGLTFRSDKVLHILSEFHPQKSKRNKDEVLEIAVTTSALALGYQISSLAYARQWNRTVFDGKCHISQGNYAIHSENPVSWCDFSPESSLFMRWGGETLTRRGFYCQQTMDLILGASTAVADLNPDLHLTLPETNMNGPLHDLVKEMDLERWHDHTGGVGGTVCFLVRTSSNLGRQKVPQKHLDKATSVDMDLDVFIPSKYTRTYEHMYICISIF